MCMSLSYFMDPLHQQKHPQLRATITCSDYTTQLALITLGDVTKTVVILLVSNCQGIITAGYRKT